MYSGKMRSIRQQVLWQAELVAAAISGESGKMDRDQFVRRGVMGGTSGKVTMSPELRRNVEEEQGRMNRAEKDNGTS